MHACSLSLPSVSAAGLAVLIPCVAASGPSAAAQPAAEQTFVPRTECNKFRCLVAVDDPTKGRCFTLTQIRTLRLEPHLFQQWVRSHLKTDTLQPNTDGPRRRWQHTSLTRQAIFAGRVSSVGSKSNGVAAPHQPLGVSSVASDATNRVRTSKGHRQCQSPVPVTQAHGRPWFLLRQSS
eukprot:360874-Chlamydomonas_euryale.AAC.35